MKMGGMVPVVDYFRLDQNVHFVIENFAGNVRKVQQKVSYKNKSACLGTALSAKQEQ